MHQHLAGNTSGDSVLGNVSYCIGRAAVYLAGVFSAEGTATVCTTSSVGVDNNFASCEACVAMRPTNDKFAGGIDLQDTLIVKKVPHLLWHFLNHLRQQQRLHVVVNAVKHLLVGLFLSQVIMRFDKIVMLSADDDSVDAHRLVGLAVIFHGHLALGIGTQVRYHTRLAQSGKFAQYGMRQVESQRHVVGSLVASKSEHHTLVTSPLALLVVTVNTAVDVVALLMQCREHSARVTVKLVLTLGVTNLVDYIACNIHQVDVGVAFHFSCYDDLPCCYKGLASHAAVGVKSQEIVE